MTSCGGGGKFLVLLLLSFAAESWQLLEEDGGKRWAVLVAGSNGYGNYRHQADICHAYQIMKKGGLKDENIIVFMYDDIAYNEDNPTPGIIINKPGGHDVYHGVPKDYTGENCTAQNLFAVILGNKTALTGGSGKVVNSGPKDHIFIYYADHGGPGIVEMPAGDMLYADDLNAVLKRKYQSKTYKKMAFYLEACESGSMFDGLLPNNINIYAVTASNPNESSWGTYCPGEAHHPASPEYNTCLGDLFSIAWMEDSDAHNSRTETLEHQYKVVKNRTWAGMPEGSHVMQYGNLRIKEDFLFSYIGSNQMENEQFLSAKQTSLPKTVNQRDADLLFYQYKFNKAPKGSKEKTEAEMKLNKEISHRKHVDDSMNRISELLFGHEKGSELLNAIRPTGQPLVDDWTCLKMLVKTYEEHCGGLSSYGRKYTRALANMCNAGIKVEQMVLASTKACSS